MVNTDTQITIINKEFLRIMIIRLGFHIINIIPKSILFDVNFFKLKSNIVFVSVNDTLSDTFKTRLIHELEYNNTLNI